MINCSIKECSNEFQYAVNGRKRELCKECEKERASYVTKKLYWEKKVKEFDTKRVSQK